MIKFIEYISSLKQKLNINFFKIIYQILSFFIPLNISNYRLGIYNFYIINYINTLPKLAPI